MYSTLYGALTQLWAGTSPGGTQFSGQVCLGCIIKSPPPRSDCSLSSTSFLGLVLEPLSLARKIPNSVNNYGNGPRNRWNIFNQVLKKIQIFYVVEIHRNISSKLNIDSRVYSNEKIHSMSESLVRNEASSLPCDKNSQRPAQSLGRRNFYRRPCVRSSLSPMVRRRSMHRSCRG